MINIYKLIHNFNTQIISPARIKKTEMTPITILA